MSLLNEYDYDTVWKHSDPGGVFDTGPGLENKVDAGGCFRFFPGSTTVFRLDGRTLHVLSLMQDALHQRLTESDLLAEPLPEDSFHLTLHDLVSPEMHRSEPVWADEARTTCSPAYLAEVESSLAQARELAADLRREHPGGVIRLSADRVVPLVSKSVALLMRPETEEDFALLMALYDRFEPLMPLPWRFTPHITLAYFRPGQLRGDLLRDAFAPLQPDPASRLRLELPVSALTAQRFQDMKTYADVPLRICFVCDGGLNRSVMAAALLNHLAREQSLPIQAEARAALSGTAGCPVSDAVWATLKAHGVPPDPRLATARPLQASDVPAFTAFAAISAGAADRVTTFRIPAARYEPLTRLFYGVPDPEYSGEYERAFLL